jgi:hypothetical protein
MVSMIGDVWGSGLPLLIRIKQRPVCDLEFME